MADPRFFQCRGPFEAADLLRVGNCVLDADVSAASCGPFDDVAPLDQAGPRNVSFFDNVRYKEQLRATKAGACVIHPDMKDLAPEGALCLLSETPYKSYALIARHFYPEQKPEADLSARAAISPDAKIGAGVVVDDFAVIGRGAEIGAGCWIESHAVIGDNVKIGRDCRIGAGASVTHCLVGDHVRIYPGVRIGQDGFGFAIDPSGYIKVPQLGRVIIEDGVEIGANSCIDRGAGPDTVIGRGTWIDNLVQIGHNVKVGKGCILVAQAGIAGSTVLEDYVVLGGQVGLAGHLKIGKGARIGAQAGVMRDVPAGSELIGSPALPLKQFMRQIAVLNKFVKDRNKRNE